MVPKLESKGSKVSTRAQSLASESTFLARKMIN